MHVLRTLPLVALLAAVPLVPVLQPAWSQEKPVKKAAKPIPRTAYQTAVFRMELRSDTGTLARLSPNAEPAFDFVPGRVRRSGPRTAMSIWATSTCGCARPAAPGRTSPRPRSVRRSTSSPRGRGRSRPPILPPAWARAFR